MEVGTIADKIGAHGDEHVNVLEPAAISVEQDLHELRRFVARFGLLDACPALAEAGKPEAEQLLELIDDQQQMPASETSRLLERALEAETRLPQAIIDPSGEPSQIFGAVTRRETSKRPGEALDRRAARPHVPENPLGTVWISGLLVEQAAKAGQHKRRFAAAGTSDHGGEPSVLDQPI